MSDKYQLAEYIANLMAIDAFYEDLGVRTSGFEAEIQHAIEELKKELKGDSDETRQRSLFPQRPET